MSTKHKELYLVTKLLKHLLQINNQNIWSSESENLSQNRTQCPYLSNLGVSDQADNNEASEGGVVCRQFSVKEEKGASSTFPQKTKKL